MFNNVEKKVQTLAKIIFILGIVISIIIFLIGISKYIEDKDCLEYSSYLGTGGYGYNTLVEAGNNAYMGLQMMKNSIFLFISSIISCLPLYGFGMLIESNELIAKQNKTIIDLLEKQTLSIKDCKENEA